MLNEWVFIVENIWVSFLNIKKKLNLFLSTNELIKNQLIYYQLSFNQSIYTSSSSGVN